MWIHLKFPWFKWSECPVIIEQRSSEAHLYVSLLTHKHCASGNTIGYLSDTTSCIPRGCHWPSDSLNWLNSFDCPAVKVRYWSHHWGLSLWKVEGMLEHEWWKNTSISQIWLWRLIFENKPSVALLWPIRDDGPKTLYLKLHCSMDRLLKS